MKATPLRHKQLFNDDASYYLYGGIWLLGCQCFVGDSTGLRSETSALRNLPSFDGKVPWWSFPLLNLLPSLHTPCLDGGDLEASTGTSILVAWFSDLTEHEESQNKELDKEGEGRRTKKRC